MRIIKHALLSLVRKPTKAIMIFIILFVVFGLIFTGIIIKNSIGQSKIFIRQQLGASVEMKADYAKAMNDLLSMEDYTKKLKFPLALTAEIAKDSDVKALYISEMTMAVSEKLKSSQENAMISFATEDTTLQGSSFTMIGSNQLVPIEFEKGSLTLTSGNHRTIENQYNNTLIISEQLAAKNKLSVGDNIELTSYSTKEKTKFEIIGLYSGASSFGTDHLYTSNESLEAFEKIKEKENYVSTIHFLLTDPLTVDDFIARYKTQLPSEYLYLDAGNTEYKQLTKPLDFMDAITTLILWGVFIAGTIIMIAIITIFVRDRKFEIGLLLSSGEPRFKIITQFILEIALVSAIAFTLAAGISQLTSDVAAKWIIENQLIEEEDEPNGEYAIMDFDNSSSESVQMADVAQNFDITIQAKTLMNLLFISSALIFLSAGAPLMIIVSFNPRTTLQD